MKRISNSYIALLALIIFSQGCIKENLADCNFNIAVEFIEKNNCGKDPIYTQIKNVTVFAFNESGIFIDQFSDDHLVYGTDYKLPLTLPQGKYTLVAWAGFNAAQFKTESLVKGQTTLAELYMPSYNLKNSSKEASHQPLFSGTITNVNVIDGTAQVIGLTAIAKPLTVNFSGLTVNHNYLVRISNNAVQYKFENSLLSILADDHYTLASLVPKTGEPGNYTCATSLLWPVAKYSPQLIVRDLTTGIDVLTVDIKTVLAQLDELNLDCQPDINMEISADQANPISIAIVINGWKVQYFNNEI